MARVPSAKHLPHRLVCANRGQDRDIIAIIKTQGSDTKFVAQMQPYYEAKPFAGPLAGRSVPPLSPRSRTGKTAA